MTVQIKALSPALAQSRSHHIGNPPTAFKNPWPSFEPGQSLASVFSARFGRNRNFVPVPETRDELVKVRVPDWGVGNKDGLKATWLGHAGFLVETGHNGPATRGVRVLFDAVFAERVGPWGMVGPKRFSPTPCKIEELPEVDVVAISHNHYDHLDIETIRFLWQRRQGKIKFLSALGGKQWFMSLGIADNDIQEMDWWDQIEIDVEGAGHVRMVCTPCQHFSGRGLRDHGQALWCSWVLQERTAKGEKAKKMPNRSLFFAGDTGYRTIKTEESDPLRPHCPAFSEIGSTFGPFDLALLPIGCYTPRSFMSNVHCAPEDSICVHRDIKSRKSIGMHYGSIRGGISAQYEDVRDPPRRWKEMAEKEGLKWGDEIGLCDIGETVVV